MNKEFKKKLDKYKEMIPEEKYNHSGIYCIKINGEIVYIGKSTNMLKRVANHIYHICNPLSPEGKGKKYIELRRVRRLGYDIEFDVIEYTGDTDNIHDKELEKKESYYINKYLPSLNTIIPRSRSNKAYRKKVERINLS